MRGMQNMSDICSEFAFEFDIMFNFIQSVALRFGKCVNMSCDSLKGIQR